MSIEQWNERFGQKEYVYGEDANVFVQAKGSLLPKGKLLAIAEGEGRNAVYMASLGHEVTAWDYSEAGLKKTVQLADKKGVQVETVCVDLNEAPWELESWDHIICVFGHFGADLRIKTLKHIEQAVKVGGSFVCEVYSTKQLAYKTGGPRDESMLYRPEEFLTIFHDWDIKHFFFGEVERNEGQLHQGKSHVIQFYGVKK